MSTELRKPFFINLIKAKCPAFIISRWVIMCICAKWVAKRGNKLN
jgi:hypothetical protein